VLFDRGAVAELGRAIVTPRPQAPVQLRAERVTDTRRNGRPVREGADAGRRVALDDLRVAELAEDVPAP